MKSSAMPTAIAVSDGTDTHRGVPRDVRGGAASRKRASPRDCARLLGEPVFDDAIELVFRHPAPGVGAGVVRARLTELLASLVAGISGNRDLMVRKVVVRGVDDAHPSGLITEIAIENEQAGVVVAFLVLAPALERENMRCENRSERQRFIVLGRIELDRLCPTAIGLREDDMSGSQHVVLVHHGPAADVLLF